MVNSRQKFLLENLDIRGSIVSLSSTWQEVLKRRNYPDSMVALLGKVTASSLLMASNIKFEGKITIQLQSAGELSLLVVQCDNKSNFRSLARYENLSSDNLLDIAPEGLLIISIQEQHSKEPYQGMVKVETDNISSVLEEYFNKSEQLKTIIILKSDRNMAAGIMLQELPGCSATLDDWERLKFVIETLSLQELESTDTQTVIGRIFAEDDKTVYEPEKVKFECTCSYDRTLGMLSTMSDEELADISKAKESITVGCDFCGKEYIHDALTITALRQNKKHPN